MRARFKFEKKDDHTYREWNGGFVYDSPRNPSICAYGYANFFKVDVDKIRERKFTIVISDRKVKGAFEAKVCGSHLELEETSNYMDRDVLQLFLNAGIEEDKTFWLWVEL